ncbi:hypothetical protein AB0D10_05420 [Kitasatospora sp. NPDC048545]|uniref:hypothetical protein n=1 Tax=Kitasatospora sp. NPDC048545 TaxID=3157208 RepID=UPI0033F72B93
MTEDIEVFVDWWLAASDEDRQQFIADSLPAPAERPPMVDVIRDLADYRPGSATC